MSDRYGVIFDMDGVLVDSYHAHFQSWRMLAHEHGLEITEQQFANYFGRTSREIIGELWGDVLAGDDQRVQTLDRRKEHLYREIIRNDIPLSEGLCELLGALAGDGAVLAVGSSGPPENVELVLDGTNIRHYFSAVITGADVTRGKPDPQVFLLAAERMSLGPQFCAVIEDAPAGIEAARRAEMKAIALTTSHNPDRFTTADMIITTLTDLTPNRLRKLILSR